MRRRRSVWVIEAWASVGPWRHWEIWVTYHTRKAALEEFRQSKKDGAKVRVVRYDASK